MKPEARVINALFARYGVHGPWEPLPATGLVNSIYATRDVVLRVAGDHPEAVSDARTESVATPVARAAGILAPHLIAFDDSRTLIDRPFSLWERIRGETLGLTPLDQARLAVAWREVGRELGRLHLRVRECPDPDGYLDKPRRVLELDSLLAKSLLAGRVDRGLARQMEVLIGELRPYVTPKVEVRFLHYDVHPMNVMCSPSGALRALIDWGDAGWGDPTLEFAAIPFDSIPDALQGYESESPGDLGDFPAARFVWDKLFGALEDAGKTPIQTLALSEYRQFLRSSRSHGQPFPR